MLFTDKQRSSALAQVRFAPHVFTLVPSDTVAPRSLQWYYTNIWSVAQTSAVQLSKLDVSFKIVMILYRLSLLLKHCYISKFKM